MNSTIDRVEIAMDKILLVLGEDSNLLGVGQKETIYDILQRLDSDSWGDGYKDALADNELD